MITFNISDINGIYYQIQYLKKISNEMLQKIRDDINSINYITEQRLRSIISCYNNSINDLKNFKESIKVSIFLQHIHPSNGRSELIGDIQSVLIECEKILGILKNNLDIKLTENQQNTLRSLREQVEKLNLEEHYEKNINFAIDHFEKGGFLACSLICSRIISFCMDQIPKKEDKVPNKQLKKSDDEKRLDYLIDVGIIDKDQKDKINRIIRYARKARDLLTHDIKVIPDVSDSMSLLGDCVDILTIFNKIQEKERKNGKYEP